MIFVYVLALIGLLSLLALAALAVLSAGRQASDKEPADSFDLALSAVARLQGAAWRAVQELRDLDSHRKE